MAAKTEEKKKIDISKFFTRKNEEDGVWYSPVIYGEPFGLKFKVLGSNSTKLAVVVDEYNRKRSEIMKLKSSQERADQLKELYAVSAAQRVTGLMADDKYEVLNDGKPVEYSSAVVTDIFRECPEVAEAVMQFSLSTVNFMNGKKN